MERHFEVELGNFKAELLKMATKVEESIHKSIQALKFQNTELAEEVILEDVKIDELENIIEEKAVDILALFQPMASDLRFVTTGMHINAQLERMADLSVNICQRVIELSDKPLLKPLVDIPKLAQQAKWMLKTVIDAFVERDELLAKEVILSDKISNDLRDNIMRELVYDYMVIDGRTSLKGVPLILITRDLERICDHAVAIAEDIIYMVQAKVVKHHPERLKD